MVIDEWLKNKSQIRNHKCPWFNVGSSTLGVRSWKLIYFVFLISDNLLLITELFRPFDS